jgi:flagellar assembly protein FliH
MGEQAAMLARLERSIEELAEVRSSMMMATERQLAELAAAIARRVLGQELATDPSRILELARQGIETLSDRDKLVVRVGAPLSEATLSAFFEGMKSRSTRCEVRHDPSLSPGQCIVETDLGRVDESLETRLANVLGQLLPPAESAA